MKKSIPTYVYFIIVAVISVGLIAALVMAKKGTLTKQEEELTNLAGQVGLDVEQFKADLISDDVNNSVEEQRKDVLERLGGSASTPSIYIEGERTDPAIFEDFKTVVETKLESLDEASKPLDIEVFIDYNCPACAQFDIVTYQISQEFGDDVNIVHKQLPFLKDSSFTYAKASEAARKQGDDLFLLMNANIFEYSQGERYDLETVNTILTELEAE